MFTFVHYTVIILITGHHCKKAILVDVSEFYHFMFN